MGTAFGIVKDQSIIVASYWHLEVGIKLLVGYNGVDHPRKKMEIFSGNFFAYLKQPLQISDLGLCLSC